MTARVVQVVQTFAAATLASEAPRSCGAALPHCVPPTPRSRHRSLRMRSPRTGHYVGNSHTAITLIIRRFGGHTNEPTGRNLDVLRRRTRGP